MKPCCEKPENRTPPVRVAGTDATVTVCRVCECRHYEVVLEPGELGLKGGNL